MLRHIIKRRLLRPMIAKKTKHWLDLLPVITSSYNNLYNRTIGMKPDEVSNEYQPEIWKQIYCHKIKQARK